MKIVLDFVLQKYYVIGRMRTQQTTEITTTGVMTAIEDYELSLKTLIKFKKWGINTDDQENYINRISEDIRLSCNFYDNEMLERLNKKYNQK